MLLAGLTECGGQAYQECTYVACKRDIACMRDLPLLTSRASKLNFCHPLRPCSLPLIVDFSLHMHAQGIVP